ncbi:MAG: glycosyltransferase family 2 protein [Lachnospiraceae bacterium]|nr:glycosyltransferase family 2 protein [Lachnospiraceae bacterium]
MAGGIKQTIKNIMSRGARRDYANALMKAQHQKEEGALEEQNRLGQEQISLTVKVVSFTDLLSVQDEQFDVCIAYDAAEGWMSPLTQHTFAKYFEQHPEVLLAYADEDVYLCLPEEVGKDSACVKAERRILPYHKPCPSPETLLSWQYVGGLVAFRKEALVHLKAENSSQETVYGFLLRCFYSMLPEQIAGVPSVLYHRQEIRNDISNPEAVERQLREQDVCPGSSLFFDAVKANVLRELGKSAVIEAGVVRYDLPVDPPMVSILIPSKDNPEVLHTCIASIREKTDYDRYEVIVIDNGSSQEHKAKIEKDQLSLGFTYLYEPEEFNYSRMNNKGAAVAKGEVLLLLNDDMEVISPQWLTILLGQLWQPGVGAVGAKLYYPNSNILQHAGVTNTPEDGPVHKLIGQKDDRSYGHGRNIFTRNVVGVTGACLLLRKADYEAVGGLDEALRVGYNDVDLCFNLLERGKRIVLRNDVTLYHHESLSRGHDTAPEKVERLQKERELLYKKHPKYYFRDPYEPFIENGSSGRMEEYFADGYVPRKISPQIFTKPEGIALTIEQAGEMPVQGGVKRVYEIRGTMVVPMVDNATYHFSLLLKDATGQGYSLPVQRLLREELTGRFPDAEHVKMGGFAVYLKEGQLPAGTYQIYGHGKDDSSRRRLTHAAGKTITLV